MLDVLAAKVFMNITDFPCHGTNESFMQSRSFRVINSRRIRGAGHVVCIETCKFIQS